MAGPAFISREDCSIEYVEELELDLVSDCSVPSAPGPIWEAFDFPIPVPPELAIGCPEIGIKTTVTNGQTPDNTGSFAVSVKYLEDDYCFPSFEFSIDFPIIPPCPTISISGDGNIPVDTTTQSAYFNMLFIYDSSCMSHELQVSIGIPEISIPPCPTMTINNGGTIPVEVNVPSAYFNMTFNYDSLCESHNIDVSIGIPSIDIPPCPTMTINNGGTIPVAVNVPSAYFNMTFNYDSLCESHNIDVSIGIPEVSIPPCPTVKVNNIIGGGDIPVDVNTQIPYFNMTFTYDQSCESHNIDVSIGIPEFSIPDVLCPDFGVAAPILNVIRGADGTVDDFKVGVVHDQVNCDTSVDMSLTIGIPCTEFILGPGDVVITPDQPTYGGHFTAVNIYDPVNCANSTDITFHLSVPSLTTEITTDMTVYNCDDHAVPGFPRKTFTNNKVTVGGVTTHELSIDLDVPATEVVQETIDPNEQVINILPVGEDPYVSLMIDVNTDPNDCYRKILTPKIRIGIPESEGGGGGDDCDGETSIIYAISDVEDTGTAINIIYDIITLDSCGKVKEISRGAGRKKVLDYAEAACDGPTNTCECSECDDIDYTSTYTITTSGFVGDCAAEFNVSAEVCCSGDCLWTGTATNGTVVTLSHEGAYGWKVELVSSDETTTVVFAQTQYSGCTDPKDSIFTFSEYNGTIPCTSFPGEITVTCDIA